jgi:hypothetical protein
MTKMIKYTRAFLKGANMLNTPLLLQNKCTHTMHSESIQTLSLFPYFLTLHLYSKIDQIKKMSSTIYTQYPIKKQRKQVFRNVCKYIIK